MNRILHYFTKNNQKESYIIRAKAKALTYLTFFTFAIIVVKIVADLFYLDEGGTFAHFGVAGMVASIAFINLFFLRLSNYHTAGMFFSSGIIIVFLIGMLMSLNMIHPLRTYVNGFYLTMPILSLSALFGTRKSLIINALITIACIIYVYMSSTDLYQGDIGFLAKDGVINYTIALIIFVMILFSVVKISEDAQRKTSEITEMTVKQNNEIKANIKAYEVQKEHLKVALEDTNFVVRQALESGDFKARISLENKEDEWLALGESINKLFESVTVPFDSINQIVNNMAEGDLTGRYKNEAKGEVLNLKNNLNSALQNLGGLLNEISESARIINSSSHEMIDANQEMLNVTSEITSAIKEISLGAQNQVSRTDEASVMIEGVSQFSANVGNQAKSINEAAKNGVKKSIRGTQQAGQVSESIEDILKLSVETNGSIDSLTNRSQRITQVLNIIQEIASQTNLLALNAAIEAAQAGDAGRGFAVVAEEIRKLAEDSKNSTKEIELLITDVQKDTERTASLINQMSERIKVGEKASKEGNATFEEIAKSCETTLELSQKIVEDTDQQGQDLKNIVKTVENIVIIAEQTAAGTEEAVTSSSDLSRSMSKSNERSEQITEIVNVLQKKINQMKLTV